MEAAGQHKLQLVAETAARTTPDTAPSGQEVIKEDLKMLNDEFYNCFNTVSTTQAQLGEHQVKDLL